MKSIEKFAIVGAAILTTLVGCGGGGDSSSTPPPVANSFDAAAGSYSSGCVAIASGHSILMTLVVATISAADKATVSVQAKGYSTADCSTSLRADITILGEITPLSQTKVITGTGVGSTKSGTAQAVEFKYSGIQLALGTLAFALPAPGATAKVGFLIEGNKFYALTRSRTADGLPDSFSSIVLTKQ